jgi:hypothetical protein
MNGVLIGSHVYPGQIITVIGPIIPWTLVWARLFSFGKCQNDKTEIPQIPKRAILEHFSLIAILKLN